ncbi:RNHCP domain-containing protein [Modestobacter sp. Leaf380]|uniref:RNHCP domain-containing protein n=1 Tax=Modestobacter sp. Leaf380 TaxID=1736356 RepID=UPI0009E7C548|nr:RNHCP domain-containing protein [Modestobacter sp. Leaf380]
MTEHDTALDGGPVSSAPRGRSRRAENTDFVCGHCQVLVPANTDGHYRNHCPFCLWSLHVDDKPGDRASDCRQLMQPVGLVEKSGKGWQVVHLCTACGHRQPNRLVVEGTAPDDVDLVAGLMADQQPPPATRGRGRRR